MENASKALLIAASILLAIAIIGIGMYIYQKVNITKNASNAITGLEIEQFNMKYEMYEGKQKGSMVKSLLNLASKNNESLYQDEDTIKYCVCIRSNDKTLVDSFKGNYEMTIALNGTRSYGARYPSSIKQISNKLVNSKTYNIWFNYNENGYVWEINIDTV